MDRKVVIKINTADSQEWYSDSTGVTHGAVHRLPCRPKIAVSEDRSAGNENIASYGIDQIPVTFAFEEVVRQGLVSIECTGRNLGPEASSTASYASQIIFVTAMLYSNWQRNTLSCTRTASPVPRFHQHRRMSLTLPSSSDAGKAVKGS